MLFKNILFANRTLYEKIFYILEHGFRVEVTYGPFLYRRFKHFSSHILRVKTLKHYLRTFSLLFFKRVACLDVIILSFTGVHALNILLSSFSKYLGARTFEIIIILMNI